MAKTKKWAVVLGASSGFGEACSLELARAGFDIAGVHLDRRSTMPNVERITAQIREIGTTPLYFNVNAADEEARKKVVAEVKTHLDRDGGHVHVLLHSLAFGTLRPYIAEKREECVNQKQIEMTLDVMANSLVYWTQELYYNGCFGKWARIFAMTSAGSVKVWPQYGPVSAAKAALESHIRQLAVELGKSGITANSIMAGVTDTPALRKIPGNDKLIDNALKGNPAGRLTTTEDVARFITLMSVPETSFITGNVLAVDGGELIV